MASALRAALLSALALIVAGCGSTQVHRGKMSAAALERFLRTQQPSYSEIRCARGSAGWDYVCTFRIERRRRKAAFDVNDRYPTEATWPVGLAQPVSDGEHEMASKASFARATNRACATARARIRAIAPGSLLVTRLAVAAATEREEVESLTQLRWTVPADRIEAFDAYVSDLRDLADAHAAYRDEVAAERPVEALLQAAKRARAAESRAARSRLLLGLDCRYGQTRTETSVTSRS